MNMSEKVTRLGQGLYVMSVCHVSCMSSLAQISRVKHVLDRNQLVTVINALVLSKLLYCSTVWSNTLNKNICRLQSVQNFAARIITGTRYRTKRSTLVSN